MSRSKSSKNWLDEHFNDAYVKQSKMDGYRSRASYKLIELDEKDQLLREGYNVVDLGAAPGGWSQVAVKRVGERGRVFALDILEMDPIAGVEFIQGDFTENEVYEQLIVLINNDPIDLVISDMAPNMSGMASVDQPRAMYLLELALDMARQVLRPDGRFVAKAFQGEGYDQWLKDLRSSFKQVQIRKPKSSRARSREVYVIANGFYQ